MHLTGAALAIAEPLCARPATVGAALHIVGGARVLDCGVAAAGGSEAGLGMARVALGGLGSVTLEPGGRPGAAPLPGWPDCPWPVVTVSSDAPVAACLAAQYAGWRVKEAGYFAMASGPIRAAIGREELYDDIGMRERSSAVVGLLETDRLPPAEVCRRLAADAGVPPEHLLLLVARTASLAGTLQVTARSLETALHQLHERKFDLGRVRRGSGRAPLPPVPEPADDLVAIGRTNDAILYGGHVVLEVTGDDDSLRAVGPRVVSRGSASHGEPFARLFAKAGGDFYALDPALFAPAVVEFVNVDTGVRHLFGGLEPVVVARSFGSDTGA
jgi:methenyltetrahydromethanopterin cyclohydrolase